MNVHVQRIKVLVGVPRADNVNRVQDDLSEIQSRVMKSKIYIAKGVLRG
jgi:hypothetical protein